MKKRKMPDVAAATRSDSLAAFQKFGNVSPTSIEAVRSPKPEKALGVAGFVAKLNPFARLSKAMKRK